MSDSKNNNKKNMPKINFYWVYGAIFVLLIGFQFLNSGDAASKNISTNKFSQVLIENDIKEIVIVNRTVAQIYLTDLALEKEAYKQYKKRGVFNQKAPAFAYDFGDLQNFENQLSEARNKNALEFDVKHIEQTSFMDQIFAFLPFIILIAIWLFFMRRMSGGGAGGAGGGQIFSIGKSKAKLFDKDTKVKTIS